MASRLHSLLVFKSPTPYPIISRRFSHIRRRFSHIHIDILGPLPPSKGYAYILTCVNRFARWQDAFPLCDITAATVARKVVEP